MPLAVKTFRQLVDDSLKSTKLVVDYVHMNLDGHAEASAVMACTLVEEAYALLSRVEEIADEAIANGAQ